MKNLEWVNRKYRNMKTGIKNLWKWFPIIWNDRNWDQYYLYQLLHFKLKDMEKYHRNCGHLLRADETADQLKVCHLLLERLIKDDYNENVFRRHDKKWGDVKIGWVPYKDDLNMLIFNRKNVRNDEDNEQETKEFRRLCKAENKLRQQDVDYLFKLMTKHIQGWWD